MAKRLFVAQGRGRRTLQPTVLRSGDTIFHEEGRVAIEFVRNNLEVDEEGNLISLGTQEMRIGPTLAHNDAVLWNSIATDSKVIAFLSLNPDYFEALAEILALAFGLVALRDDRLRGTHCHYFTFFTPAEAARIQRRLEALRTSGKKNPGLSDIVKR